MNADHAYGFDVCGYIQIPNVLAPDQIARASAALDQLDPNTNLTDAPARHSQPFRELIDHPVLVDCLSTICNGKYTIDGPTTLVAPGSDRPDRVPLDAGDPQTNRRLRYVNLFSNPMSNGVRAFFALATTSPVEGGIVVVPASHKRWLDPPADFLTGVDDQAMTESLILQPGDLLLLAANTMFGVRGRPNRLIQSSFISERFMPAAGYDQIDPPDWIRELSPPQQAVVGPRTSGRSAAMLSDGLKVWSADVVEQTPPPKFHLDGVPAPDPKELWYWDVRGYIVLKGVMDQPWLDAAHVAIDAAVALQPDLPDGHPSKFEDVPEAILRENNWQWPKDTSARILGTHNRPRIGGLYHLPDPHNQPFRRMIASPRRPTIELDPRPRLPRNQRTHVLHLPRGHHGRITARPGPRRVHHSPQFRTHR